MKRSKSNKNILNIIVAFSFLLSFILLGTNEIVETNARYITSAEDKQNSIKVAKWDFKVNGVSSGNVAIKLNDTIDSKNKYSTTTVIPGSTGTIDFDIDCTNANVAVNYDIKLVSSNLPSNLKLYTDDTYTQEAIGITGYVPLDNQNIVRKLYWRWNYTEEDETDTWSSKELTVQFEINATQRIDGD